MSRKKRQAADDTNMPRATALRIAHELGAVLTSDTHGGWLFYVPWKKKPHVRTGNQRPPLPKRFDPDAPPVTADQFRDWYYSLGDVTAKDVVERINAECGTSYGLAEFYGWRSGKRLIPSTVRARMVHLFPLPQTY